MSSGLDIEGILATSPRVLWVCAHPDDEFLSGALLARAGITYGCAVHILVLTRGGGGGNATQSEDLPATRSMEMQAVAERLGASVELHDFWNAPLPVSSFPSRKEILRRWRDQGDPLGVVAATLKRFAPDLVLTFEPTFGATGHPEHQLASRLTTTAVRAMDAADAPLVLYALRRHWIFRMMRQADPGPVDGWFEGSLPWGEGAQSCQELLVELTRLHATQNRDLAPFRRFARLFERLALRRVDVEQAPSLDTP